MPGPERSRTRATNARTGAAPGDARADPLLRARYDLSPLGALAKLFVAPAPAKARPRTVFELTEKASTPYVPGCHALDLPRIQPKQRSGYSPPTSATSSRACARPARRAPPARGALRPLPATRAGAPAPPPRDRTRTLALTSAPPSPPRLDQRRRTRTQPTRRTSRQGEKTRTTRRAHAPAARGHKRSDDPQTILKSRRPPEVLATTFWNPGADAVR